ncbi:hypothetical protein SAMD00019534_013230 [Acytostelium subglobosum LB1]|uniref:hypothetical protein n=1 Tax=Acytostelium subglobosum LB1 TaxID=1410327 RepID=UPI000644A8C3|nr:hypothetical protein SAMD00019534_013230 [Acytostelium subglobosum LB1]GAM18148.1 hypothetical protein SAMD00019534_013230 [Acytostelium subglobosum LB1]|eukprot:XP_012758744.1 hypothetical protein SAMD00019534_013230 [Acytostelium subglobosum LB1]
MSTSEHIYANESIGDPSIRLSLMTIKVGDITSYMIGRIPIYVPQTGNVIMYTSYTFNNYQYFIMDGRRGNLFGPTNVNDYNMLRNLVTYATVYPSYVESNAYKFSTGPYINQTILDSNGVLTTLLSPFITSYDQSVITQLGQPDIILGLDSPNGKFYDGPHAGNNYHVVSFDFTPMPVFQVNESFSCIERGGCWIIMKLVPGGMSLTSSNYTVLINGARVTGDIRPFTDNSSLGFFVPPGSGTDLMMEVIVEGVATSGSNRNFLTYWAPKIMSASQVMVNETSSVITLSGRLFGANLTIMDVYVNDLKQTPQMATVTVANTETIYLTVPPGVNDLNISVVVATQPSNYFLIPRLVVSTATSLVKMIPGQVTITGRGFRDGMSVAIGGAACTTPVVAADGLSLVCQFDASAPGDSKESLFVNVSTLGVYDQQQRFLYIDNGCGTEPLCSGHGTCTNGICICTPQLGYDGPLCSIPINGNNNQTPSVTDRNGTIGDFKVFFTHIREIDELGNTVVIFPASDLITKSKEKVGNRESTIGTLLNITGFTINITSIVFDQDTTWWFAGQAINIGKNGFKYQIELNGWPFNSRNNVLQLIYELQSDKNVDNGCSKTDSANSYDNADNLLWVQIQLGNQYFLVQFANRMLVDNRVAASHTLLLDVSDSIFQQPYFVQQANNASSTSKNRLVVGMAMPFFASSVIDPTFSVLINNKGQSANCPKASLWWIAIVVAGVAVAAGIAVGAYFRHKKNDQLKKRISQAMELTASNR